MNLPELPKGYSFDIQQSSPDFYYVQLWYRYFFFRTLIGEEYVIDSGSLESHIELVANVLARKYLGKSYQKIGIIQKELREHGSK